MIIFVLSYRVFINLACIELHTINGINHMTNKLPPPLLVQISSADSPFNALASKHILINQIIIIGHTSFHFIKKQKTSSRYFIAFLNSNRSFSVVFSPPETLWSDPCDLHK